MDWARILPDWFFPLWSTLLGLVLGSFANVCIHRLPSHGSILRPRSACPGCQTPVRARDNIPVLSKISRDNNFLTRTDALKELLSIL